MIAGARGSGVDLTEPGLPAWLGSLMNAPSLQPAECHGTAALDWCAASRCPDCCQTVQEQQALHRGIYSLKAA